jgi:hypothetical protein
VVDNFGIKYVNEDNVQHLIASIKRITPFLRVGRGIYIVGYSLSKIMSIADYVQKVANKSLLTGAKEIRH